MRITINCANLSGRSSRPTASHHDKLAHFTESRGGTVEDVSEEVKTPRQRGLRRYIPEPERYRARYGNRETTERDIEILAIIHRYRHLTTPHLLALLNPDGSSGRARRICQRLQGLFHRQYVRRYGTPRKMRPELERSGGRIDAYGLDTKGWKELLSRRPDDYRQENEEAAPAWQKIQTTRLMLMLEHQLQISNVHCALECALRDRDDAELWEWDQSIENRVSGALTLPDGRKERISVAPDAYFALDVDGELHHRFLEVDRGTMTQRRIRLKISSYWRYFGSSAYAEGHDNHKQVAVLFTAPSKARLENLIETVRNAAKDLPRVNHGGTSLFWFALEKSIDVGRPESALERIWVSANPPDEPRALV